MPEQYDMTVLGGGPGGYVAALRGRQLGLSVALVESERIGGVCLNRGCIPTKALIADVEGCLWARRAAREGIIDREPVMNFPAMQRRKADVVERMVSSLEKHLDASGVTLISARGSIAEPGRVITDNAETIRSSSIVIATGSRSWMPRIPGLHSPRVKTTRTILEMESVPQRLTIIGAGVIGQEFAAIFAALGTRVTVLEALGRILNEVDGEIARRYASLLPGRGISTETGVRIEAIEATAEGLRVVYENKGKEKISDADLVLMATGRRPNLDGVEAERLGIRLKNGAVDVDRFLRTSLEGIYAVGDVIGRKMLAHSASYQGEIVAECVAGVEKPCEDEFVPACVFTVPQIAWVGLTEEQAKETGRPFRTSTFAMASSGKAQAMGEPFGLFKLIEDSETGKLTGAHLLGPHASELLGEMTLALKMGLSASDLIEIIHPHPTISEAIRECALGLRDGPIHATARTKSFNG